MVQKIYANFVGVRVVAEDFALMLSLLDNPGAVPSNEVTADYQVYLSPVLAKKVSGILNTTISQYESMFGPIKTEPDVEAAKVVMKNLPTGAVMKIGRGE